VIDISRELQVAIRTGEVIFGVRRTIKALLEGRAKLVVMAANCPPEHKSDIEYYARLSNTPIFTYPGSSIELGAACRRPHKISAIAIINPGESNILNLLTSSQS